MSLDDDFGVIEIGVDMIWNCKLGMAQELFQPCTNSLQSFYYGEVSFMEAILSEDKEVSKECFKRLDNCRKLAEKELAVTGKKLPKDTDPDVKQKCTRLLRARIVQAEASLWDAALKMKLENHIKAIYYFRKSWIYYTKALEFCTQIEAKWGAAEPIPFYSKLKSCVDCGVGFFLVMISIVPREWLWIIEGIGFRGDRKKGVAHLHAAVDADGIRSSTAMMHLIWINAFFFEKFDEGEKWLQALLAKHPQCAIMQYLGGYVFRKQGKMELSEQYFRDAESNTGQMQILKKYCEYDIAFGYFLRCDWEEALSRLTSFLGNGENVPSGFRCTSAYQIGMCHYMLGRTDQALKSMQLLLPWVRKDFEYDEVAKSRARKFTSKKGQFSEFEKTAFCASLVIEGTNYQRGLELLAEAQKNIQNPEDEAVYYYLLGTAQYKLGQIEEAVTNLKNVVALEKKVKNEKYTLPNSLATLGEIYAARDEKSEALVMLKKAKGYSGYEFSQLLGWKISRLLESINAPDDEEASASS